MATRNTISAVLSPGLGMAALAAALALAGCSHAALDRRINDQLAAEPAVQDNAEIQAETKDLISNLKGVTPEQRSQLASLRTAVQSQEQNLRVDSLKLRAVLVKDLMQSKFDEDEVELIKTRLRATEEKRLTVMFDAVAKADAILGHDTDSKHAVLHGLLHPGMYGHEGFDHDHDHK